MVEKVLAVISPIPPAIIALLRDFGIGIIAGIISGYLVYYSLQKKNLYKKRNKNTG